MTDRRLFSSVLWSQALDLSEDEASLLFLGGDGWGARFKWSLWVCSYAVKVLFPERTLEIPGHYHYLLASPGLCMYQRW